MNHHLDDLSETPWPTLPEAINQITHRVIGRAMEVHKALGPGLPEKLYEAALVHELRGIGLTVKQQHDIRVRYKDILLPELTIDVLVEDLLVLELKALEKVPEVHLAMLVSYLRAGGYPVGLLINFGAPTLKQGIYRRIHSEAVQLAAARDSIQKPRHQVTFPVNPNPVPTTVLPSAPSSAPSATSAFKSC